MCPHASGVLCFTDAAVQWVKQGQVRIFSITLQFRVQATTTSAAPTANGGYDSAFAPAPAASHAAHVSFHMHQLPLQVGRRQGDHQSLGIPLPELIAA